MAIEGDRVLLREYEEEDFGAFQALISDSELRALSVLRTPETEAEARLEFNELLADRNRGDRWRFIFAAFLKEDGTFLADAGFEVLKRNATGGVAEIGYFLDRRFRGRGYATEIASLLIAHCFTAMRFHKVIACCDGRNAASEKVMLRCGMRKEGEFARQRFKGDGWFDELRYGILKEEWMARNP